MCVCVCVLNWTEQIVYWTNFEQNNLKNFIFGAHWNIVVALFKSSFRLNILIKLLWDWQQQPYSKTSIFSTILNGANECANHFVLFRFTPFSDLCLIEFVSFFFWQLLKIWLNHLQMETTLYIILHESLKLRLNHIESEAMLARIEIYSHRIADRLEKNNYLNYLKICRAYVIISQRPFNHNVTWLVGWLAVILSSHSQSESKKRKRLSANVHTPNLIAR